MKRIFLFLVTNLAVVVTLSVVASVLGINQYITAQGLDFGALLMFAAVFGFGGIASGAAGIAKTLFYLFLVVFVVTLLLGLMTGRRSGA